MARIARVLVPEEVAAMPWAMYVHRPSVVEAVRVTESCVIHTEGDQPNLYLLPGDYVVRDADGELWKVEGSKFEYDPK